jgi:hypothetical protein
MGQRILEGRRIILKDTDQRRSALRPGPAGSDKTRYVNEPAVHVLAASRRLGGPAAIGERLIAAPRRERKTTPRPRVHPPQVTPRARVPGSIASGSRTTTSRSVRVATLASAAVPHWQWDAPRVDAQKPGPRDTGAQGGEDPRGLSGREAARHEPRRAAVRGWRGGACRCSPRRETGHKTPPGTTCRAKPDAGTGQYLIALDLHP